MLYKKVVLFLSLIKLGTKLLPMVTKLLPGVATGAMSALTDFGVSKELGSGMSSRCCKQKGGFMIPQDKINQLIAHKSLLTKKQKEQIMAALQSGGQLVIQPAPKQRGGFLGTLLASIGIPMLVKALTGGNLQNQPSAVRNILNIPKIPEISQSQPSQGGTGLQNRPYSDLFLPYQPPPFYGNWGNPTDASGSGMKKKQKKRSQKGK